MDSRCGECVTFAAAGGSRPYRRRMANPRYLLGDARWFHAYSRGTGPMVIYRNAGDFQTFSRMLAWTVRKFEWELYAYCLMPTHYHLLLQTPLERLSAGMHRLNGGYAQTFNRRHGRVGHLFGSRFHARVIEGEDYFERAASYIVWNPVRAGHCATPGRVAVDVVLVRPGRRGLISRPGRRLGVTHQTHGQSLDCWPTDVPGARARRRREREGRERERDRERKPAC